MQQKTKTILWVVGIIVILLVVTAVIMDNSPSPITQSSRGIGLAVGSPGENAKFSAMGSDAFEESVMNIAVADEVAPQSPATERLIIRTGALSIVVKNVSDSVKAINSFASENQGFVVSSNIYKVGDSPFAVVTIRIPSDIFDQGFSKMKELGDVESENTSGRDVTEEYVDLEARLKNLQLTESRLQDILNRTGTIPEVLEVERELKIVRGEIESMQGRMKYLQDSADMSSITVNLSTDPSVLPAVDESDKWRPLGVIKEAARSMVNALEGVANLIIWLVVYLPIWLILGLLGFIGVRLFKRFWR